MYLCTRYTPYLPEEVVKVWATFIGTASYNACL